MTSIYIGIITICIHSYKILTPSLVSVPTGEHLEVSQYTYGTQTQQQL